MSLLLSCQSLSKSYAGLKPLFQDFDLSIFAGDRIGLVGLNGCGKSTLLKILVGLESPDSGMLSPRRGLTIGYVPQSCEFPDLSPKEILMKAIKEDLSEYEKERLAKIELDRLGFTKEESSAAKLSGGWKKRLRIGVELISKPELLLLDEPTNHLDLEGILWLENFLKSEAPTYLLVSHDRYFLQAVTNKIIEINQAYPKGLFISDGSYSDFLVRKEEFLQGQIEQEKRIATKVRRETDWLRQGVKARTTKAQSRIDEAGRIIEAHADIKSRNEQKRTKIDFSATERQTVKLLVAKNLSKSLGNKLLFQRLDFTLSPGTRMGLMGPNGSGKTTLLRMLFDEIEPDVGTIKRNEDLKTVYFDQHKAKLPLEMSLKQALSPSGDFVTFRGSKIHVNGWCKRFLFSPDLLDLPIGKLSGGERARISIAHLMLQPVDILLLDEPTNDLDIPTLETLEESLLEFPGAIVLITHDRCMMDRVCNSVLSLGNSQKPNIFTDYRQWEASTKQSEPPIKEDNKQKEPSAAKISYQAKKELDAIERKIIKLEEDVHNLNHLLEKPEVAENPTKLEEVCNKIGLVKTQIEELYLQWDDLHKKNF